MAPNHNETEIQLHPASRPRALHRFALFTAALTLLLLSAGGLVTSHGVGMAVPDWPNTFGYNMFFFPFSQWVGGVFYEHSHRLIASAVGFCTSVLTIWLYGKRARRFLLWLGVVLIVLSLGTLTARPVRWSDAVVLGICGVVALSASFVWPRCEPAPPWLRRLGFVAFIAVVLQGVLGGLRVVLFKDQIGIFHATLAQLFFALSCALALFTSSWWEKRFGSPWNSDAHSVGAPSATASPQVAWLCLITTLFILAQLVLGATLRHQHAGLAIPDFPTAYGKLWPALDPLSVSHYNQQRIEVLDVNPITAFQIELQMIHRLLALVIFCLLIADAALARSHLGSRHIAGKLTLAWLGFIFVQALLGAATIWSNKAADIATLHVVVGAISLALGSTLSIVLFAEIGTARGLSFAAARRGFNSSHPFATPAISSASND